MKIGLNLLYLLPGQVGGTETYATELIRALGAANQDDDFVVFLNLEAADFPIPTSPKFRRVVCSVHATNRVSRYLYEQLVLPFLAVWHRLDILHSLGYVGPIFLFQKHLITIHDANFVRLSHLMSPARRLVFGIIARLSAKTSNFIVTDSSFSKKELNECLGVPSAKMAVVHLGAPRPMEAKDDHPGRLALQRPYILVLGGGSLHKNIRSFVLAFASVQDRFPHNLVIAGRLNESLDDAPGVLGLIKSGRITITGFLDPADLNAVYSGANLFVFPTLYEGFGLPLLEAQIHRLPVMCSRVASLPEIGGDSVAYFDPTSIDDMAAKLADLIGKPESLKELVECGQVNVQRFTWEGAAAQTLSIYRQIFT